MNRTTRNSFLFAPAIAFTLLVAVASAASFEISRIALSFDDQKAATIVERGSRLTAQAEVSYSGNGLLRATWEVAGPNPDGNNPQYRVLTNVQQPLTGRDAAIVKSPSLPTESTGAYLVRLKVTEPSLGFSAPTVRYSVNEKKN